MGAPKRKVAKKEQQYNSETSDKKNVSNPTLEQNIVTPKRARGRPKKNQNLTQNEKTPGNNLAEKNAYFETSKDLKFTDEKSASEKIENNSQQSVDKEPSNEIESSQIIKKIIPSDVESLNPQNSTEGCTDFIGALKGAKGSAYEDNQDKNELQNTSQIGQKVTEVDPKGAENNLEVSNLDENACEKNIDHKRDENVNPDVDESENDDSDDSESDSFEDQVDICERKDLPDNLKDRARKLAELRIKMKKSAVDNKKDLYKEFEDSKKTLPNLKHDRKRKEAQELLLKQKIEDSGLDYERLRSWNYSIEGVSKYNKKLEEKEKNTVIGFADYNDVSQRKYNKLVKELKPDVELYKYQKSVSEYVKSVHGDSINTYEDLTMVLPTDFSKPSQSALDRLSTSIVDQQVKHARAIKPPKETDDVTFINDRNAHFNRKINRAFDKYTKDIRESFERGTAL
ncbi:hypothetical protein BB561_005984 [Smittium simulii]|uniref:Pre-mRNA-splicing factor SYF2 n=1 Tax=Smittium simulii TaxID=133385 RepID=A0A2T9Y799_9FUNG|nr:hypothetical protein BB561_005984 [Smittium simulii]